MVKSETHCDSALIVANAGTDEYDEIAFLYQAATAGGRQAEPM